MKAANQLTLKWGGRLSWVIQGAQYTHKGSQKCRWGSRKPESKGGRLSGETDTCFQEGDGCEPRRAGAPGA